MARVVVSNKKNDDDDKTKEDNGLEKLNTTSFFPTAREMNLGIQWLRGHPVLATASAAAATAFSFLDYIDKQQQHHNHEDRPLREDDRVVSWGDEVDGGTLCHTINDNTSSKRLTRVSSSLKKLKKPLATIVKETEVNEASPQWGWYVAITPPQDLASSLPPSKQHTGTAA